jgi:hypothetical protein
METPHLSKVQKPVLNYEMSDKMMPWLCPDYALIMPWLCPDLKNSEMSHKLTYDP